MAEIQPLRALHYDPDKTGGLQGVVAPPYDVIDDAPRPKLQHRSPYNVRRVNLSPIFSLFDDAGTTTETPLGRVTANQPWAETTDDDGTRNRLWRVDEEPVIGALTGALEDKELLIADGHHRYETARMYAEEVG